MKNYRTILLLLLAAALVAAGCRSRTDRSEGTVLLTVDRVSDYPVSLSLSSPPELGFQIGTVVLHNVAKDPTGSTSSLQTIEMRSYTITYRRRDTGTRVPPPAVLGLSGNVGVGTTATFNNLAFLTHDQLLSQPLKDLIDFGRDTETGTAVVVLDVTLQFFGRTLSGDEIASSPTSFTIDVTP